ncbi:serine hydrolase domain-containing protein [Allosphingosinicella indica]|uniref:Beta-lactamase class C n=1 Tax=Allosphingosinicella indica TaxID=941907 RepID=A0A1X7GZQ7_9SPHN|nr:serine hydrolase domain-containing protein [Allosphingosinicella indica]SMF76946.1 beta-lactamase class C [Allosphingosinicella indica]
MITKRVLAVAAAVFVLGGAAWGFGGLTQGWLPAEEAPAEPQVDVTEIRDLPAKTDGPIDYRRLDQRFQLLSQQNGMVGLAVAIVEDGEIRFLKGYGETVKGSGDPVTPNTLFRWASVSKGVAGDMIAKLAAENKLSLYEPVAKYSASLKLPNGNEYKATVADVLSHQLGLFSHAQDGRLEDGLDPKMLRSSLVTLNAICSPGQCHAYQNVAYDAASEIVEKVTGRKYEDAVREQLFLPLGMDSANMTRKGLVEAKSWAQPHVAGGRPVEVVDSYYRVPAAGGVNSSIKDLALWMRAQMATEPEVLSPEVLAAVRSPRAATPGENGRMRKYRERLSKSAYGLGWRSYDYAGHLIVGHRGGVMGYRSLVLYDPKRKTGVAALWNAPTSQPGGLEFEVLDMLYRLPVKDWLDLDGKTAKAPPEPDDSTQA